MVPIYVSDGFHCTYEHLLLSVFLFSAIISKESNCQHLLSLEALNHVITLVLLMTCPAIGLFHMHTN